MGASILMSPMYDDGCSRSKSQRIAWPRCLLLAHEKSNPFSSFANTRMNACTSFVTACVQRTTYNVQLPD